MFITADSTNLKGREALRHFFRNGNKLSENQFTELINATLNKHDDRFYGVWKAGITYRKGDIVYYDRGLWEMTAEGEICSREEEAPGQTSPGQTSQWTSRLKDLENKVETLEQTLEIVQKDLISLQQDLANFKKQVTQFLTLLTLGFGFVFLWLLVSAIAHFI